MCERVSAAADRYFLNGGGWRLVVFGSVCGEVLSVHGCRPRLKVAKGAESCESG